MSTLLSLTLIMIGRLAYLVDVIIIILVNVNMFAQEHIWDMYLCRVFRRQECETYLIEGLFSALYVVSGNE